MSAPTWNKISFLNADGIHFGVFGYTGSDTHVGWHFPAPVAYVVDTPNILQQMYSQFLFLSDDRLNDGLFHNLTCVLILIPIGKSAVLLSAPCPQSRSTY